MAEDHALLEASVMPDLKTTLRYVNVTGRRWRLNPSLLSNFTRAHWLDSVFGQLRTSG